MSQRKTKLTKKIIRRAFQKNQDIIVKDFLKAVCGYSFRDRLKLCIIILTKNKRRIRK